MQPLLIVHLRILNFRTKNLHDTPRPRPEGEPVLHRVLAIDRAKHLSRLRNSEPAEGCPYLVHQMVSHGSDMIESTVTEHRVEDIAQCRRVSAMSA